MFDIVLIKQKLSFEIYIMNTENNDDLLEYILSKEKIPDIGDYVLRPLSIFHKFIENEKKIDIEYYGGRHMKSFRKGLALCHGHNYSNEYLSHIKFIKYWYMVDIDSYVYPDYAADIANEDNMSYFPDDYFDCVATIHCPVTNIRDKKTIIIYDSILKNIYRILKPQGVALLRELPGLYFYFINDEQTQELINIIKKNITEKEFNEYKDKLMRDYPDMDKQEVYLQIFMLTYDGPNHEKLNKDIYDFSIQATKKYLKKYKFRILREKAGYLVVLPDKK